MNRQFISAGTDYTTIENHIPAPYLRRVFELPFAPERATLRICGLGFYRIFINGTEITKGHLAPYISNPDHFCYYDEYDLMPVLQSGRNAIGLILGNGMMNALGGSIWGFDKAPWRGAPRVALEAEISAGENRVCFVADERFRTAESPIRFDDLRHGEIYDAREEIAGWNLPDFDDREWKPAKSVPAPNGTFRKCGAEPIRIIRTVKPVQIFRNDTGYLYDFGINSAGICRLRLRNATAGQKLIFRYGELRQGYELQIDSVVFPTERFPDYFGRNQKNVYYAKGGVEEWAPSFTYHGFRYVQAEGLNEEQATSDLLEFEILSSDLNTIGGFSCSNETANTLFSMVQNADRSNFYYFPTDCPHREKNGWTGDAAASCFHMEMLYDCEASLREWLANIRAAQNERGILPGIVPTDSWGYDRGNGPAWDAAAFHLPYVLWKYRGNTDVIRENAEMMFRYLQYAQTRRNENGTVSFGLGDWASVGRRISRPETPLEVTDSIVIMNLAKEAAEMFEAIGDEPKQSFAWDVYRGMRSAIRRELLDPDTATIKGRTQTGQAMGLYYGVFDKDERARAFAVLTELIHEKNDSFDCGFLGLSVIFHVLSDFGDNELAWKMITKRDYPSYAHLIEQGETALPEHFMPDGAPTESHNHHFFGDIARWFIREVAGLRVENAQTVVIRPANLREVDSAEAYYDLPMGRVAVKWKREQGKLSVQYSCPEAVECRIDADGAEIRRK